MLIGGSSTIPGLAGHLEEALQALQPGYAKDVMIGRPPRELDAQVVVWKGGSVFGRMARTNDSWLVAASPFRCGRIADTTAVGSQPWSMSDWETGYSLTSACGLSRQRRMGEGQ